MRAAAQMGLGACLLWALALAAPQKRAYDTHDYYVAEIAPHGACGMRVGPRDVAEVLGIELVERVGELQDYWLMRTPQQSHVRRNGHDPVVARWKQLRADDGLVPRCAGCIAPGCAARAVPSLEFQTLRQRHKRSVIYDPVHMRDEYPELRPPIRVTAEWMADAPAEIARRAPTPLLQNNATEHFASRFHISDPIFYQQWHIANAETPGNDLNLTQPWAQNVSGRGVTVSLIDDGVDMHHPDLVAAFNPKASYDFNDHTHLPEPRIRGEDTHGTRCAGEIAAASNDVCGVGVAPGANVSGVRILSGTISDADEAAALNYGFQTSSIYSCSWGPSDNGRSMDGPHGIVAKALLNGIYNGRQGRGSLFVFAGGNGGISDDQCNFDGYTNSIYTITIAAVDSQGRRPYYSEMCSAIIASSWSSGHGKQIHTSDASFGDAPRCAHSHGGTSAAAPLVAGMLALVLEVRPELTWRDVQHIIIRSTFANNPRDPDWQRTAAGYMYSHKFGFGVVDAMHLVENARNHTLVAPQTWLETPRQEVNVKLPLHGAHNATIEITPDMLAKANLASLEHVTVDVWIGHERRGSVRVVLYGPHKTKSVLASPRRYDAATTGFNGWRFMTLKHWDESPVGRWTLEVSDHTDEDDKAVVGSAGSGGNFTAWSMTLWGAARNASLARPLWDVSTDPNFGGAATASASLMPVIASPSVSSAFSSVKLTKPTHVLPGDHDVQPGESQEVFGDRPEADTGYLEGLAQQPHTWLFVAAGVGCVAGVSLLVYFLRRRARSYEHIPTDEPLPLDFIGGRGSRPGAGDVQGRELYDAFALGDDEVSDEVDADTIDKETGSRYADEPPEQP